MQKITATDMEEKQCDMDQSWKIACMCCSDSQTDDRSIIYPKLFPVYSHFVQLGMKELSDTSKSERLRFNMKLMPKMKFRVHTKRAFGIAKGVPAIPEQHFYLIVDLAKEKCYTRLLHNFPGMKHSDILLHQNRLLCCKEKVVLSTRYLPKEIHIVEQCPIQGLECMHLNLTEKKMFNICHTELQSIGDSSLCWMFTNILSKPSHIIQTRDSLVKYIIYSVFRCSKLRKGLTENNISMKESVLEDTDLQMEESLQTLYVKCNGGFLANSSKKITVITDTCTALVVRRYLSIVLAFENDFVSYIYDSMKMQCSPLEFILLESCFGKLRDIKYLMQLLFSRGLLRDLLLHHCFMYVLFFLVYFIFSAAKNRLIVSSVPTLFNASRKECRDLPLEEFSFSEENDNKDRSQLLVHPLDIEKQKAFHSGIEKSDIYQNNLKNECIDNQLQEISLSEKNDKKIQSRQCVCKSHTIDLKPKRSSIRKADIDQNDLKAKDDVKNTLRQNTSYRVDHPQVLTVFPLEKQGQNKRNFNSSSQSNDNTRVLTCPQEQQGQNQRNSNSSCQSCEPQVGVVSVLNHLSVDSGESSPLPVEYASVKTGQDCFKEVPKSVVKRHTAESSDNGEDVIDSINFDKLPEDRQTSIKDAVSGSLGEGACGGFPTADSYLVNNHQISPCEKTRTCAEKYSVEESVREDSYHSCEDEQDKGGEDLQVGANATSSPSQHQVEGQHEPFPTPAVDDSDIQKFEPMMDIINKLAAGKRVPPQETMRYEMLRFCTLRSFPKENKPFITRIAQAGFYYANNRDEVVCYCCAKRKSNWTENDNPMAVHQQLNPSCKFLLNNAEVNVSVQKQHELANRQSIPAPGTASSSTNSLIAATANAQTRNGLQGTSHLFSALPNTSRSTAAPNTSTSITVSSTLASSTFTMASTFQQSFYRPPIVTDSVSNIAHGNFASGAIASPIPSSIAGLTATALTRPTTTLASSIVNSSTVATLVSSKANIQTCTVTTQSTVSTFSTVTRPSTVAAPSTVTSPSTVATPGTVTRPSTVTSPSTVSTSAANRSAAAPAADPPTPAKYPAYSDQSVRHASFRDCTELRVPAENLAEAGFFYAGFGDCCRCFQCGVGLRHWSAEDDPWIEHSRWSRNCSFVKEKKGEEFVILVQMAVDYQQNQQRQQQQEAETTGSNQETVENLLHSDAAQSVLEMGYSPDVIRRAIHEVLESTGLSDITASTLMEVIFNFEESAGHARSQSSPPVASGGQSSEPREQTSQLSSENRSTESSPGEAVGNMASVIGVTSSTAVKSGSAKRANIIKQKKLKEENDRMKLQSICTLCKDKDVCIVFLPCGHLVTCEQCAEKVRYCPVRTCAKYIKGTVRTYVA